MWPSSTPLQPWRYYVLLLLATLGALLLVSRLRRRRHVRKARLLRRHFLITGGSSGIGLALAREVVRRGANVTLVARNLNRLREVKTELREVASSPEQVIHTLSADLTEGESGDAALARGVVEAENVCGPVDYLVNCAGAAVSHRFEETQLSDFRRMMEASGSSATLFAPVVSLFLIC
ncbi:hypothetical protein V5799_009859 [Amblyomma americanum]|uniref:Uncharacterized protein n=1 Tax=Amblyomma americanum TaxID=6943 RepID=A0AAQ4F9N9_AMBAM